MVNSPSKRVVSEEKANSPTRVYLRAAAVPSVEAVRFSLHYVDAVKIDTKSCELCASSVRASLACGRRVCSQSLVLVYLNVE